MGGGWGRLRVLLVRGHTQRERMKERRELGDTYSDMCKGGRNYREGGAGQGRAGQGCRSISNFSCRKYTASHDQIRRGRGCPLTPFIDSPKEGGNFIFILLVFGNNVSRFPILHVKG